MYGKITLSMLLERWKKLNIYEFHEICLIMVGVINLYIKIIN